MIGHRLPVVPTVPQDSHAGYHQGAYLQTRWGYTVPRAASSHRFGIHFLLESCLVQPTIIPSQHLLLSIFREAICLPPITSMLAHHLPRQSVQSRSLFCFPKALLRIKNCEKVVLCFHAQHENRISFTTAIYARSVEYHFCRLSMPNHWMNPLSYHLHTHRIIHIMLGISYPATIVCIHIKVYSKD